MQRIDQRDKHGQHLRHRSSQRQQDQQGVGQREKHKTSDEAPLFAELHCIGLNPVA